MPVTGSWLARVTRPRVPDVLSLTSQAQPEPWMPARAALACFLRLPKEPKSSLMAVYGVSATG